MVTLVHVVNVQVYSGTLAQFHQKNKQKHEKLQNKNVTNSWHYQWAFIFFSVKDTDYTNFQIISFPQFISLRCLLIWMDTLASSVFFFSSMTLVPLSFIPFDLTLVVLRCSVSPCHLFCSLLHQVIQLHLVVLVILLRHLNPVRVPQLQARKVNRKKMQLKRRYLVTLLHLYLSFS